MCGVAIEPNAMNMCASCVATEVDVAEGVELDSELVQCRGCLRYQPRGKGQQASSYTGAWLWCDWESKELMALCLKSIQGLHKAKLMDAGFIWTEPHSKRVKLKLTLQREVMNHARVQNSCVASFVVKTVQCPDCTKQYRNNRWRALVQIRQKAEHKRTFLRLEQEILKHKAHADAIGITSVKEGIDFYFGSKSAAERFMHFLISHVPMRAKSSSKLISENVHNGTANLQTTYSVELCPICKDDLLVLPPKFAASCGNISPLVLCARTTSLLHLLDPRTGQHAELAGEKYWKVPFLALETSPALSEFVVLDVEPVESQTSQKNAPSTTTGRKKRRNKFVVADVEVARASDFGVNDTTFIIRTHLGAVLHAGDTVKGYDLTTSNFGTRQTNALKGELPDIVLVRRVFTHDAFDGEKKKQQQEEKRKLQTLGAQRRGKVSKAEAARMEQEMEAFTEEYLAEELEAQLDDDEEEEGEFDEEEGEFNEDEQDEELEEDDSIDGEGERTSEDAAVAAMEKLEVA